MGKQVALYKGVALLSELSECKYDVQVSSPPGSKPIDKMNMCLFKKAPFCLKMDSMFHCYHCILNFTTGL